MQLHHITVFCVAFCIEPKYKNLRSVAYWKFEHCVDTEHTLLLNLLYSSFIGVKGRKFSGIELSWAEPITIQPICGFFSIDSPHCCTSHHANCWLSIIAKPTFSSSLLVLVVKPFQLNYIKSVSGTKLHPLWFRLRILMHNNININISRLVGSENLDIELQRTIVLKRLADSHGHY